LSCDRGAGRLPRAATALLGLKHKLSYLRDSRGRRFPRRWRAVQRRRGRTGVARGGGEEHAFLRHARGDVRSRIWACTKTARRVPTVLPVRLLPGPEKGALWKRDRMIVACRVRNAKREGHRRPRRTVAPSPLVRPARALRRTGPPWVPTTQLFGSKSLTRTKR